MAEQDKQYTGDGSDNYANAARQTAQAAKQIGQASTQKAAVAGGETAAQAAAAGVEATANAAAATVQAGVEGGKAVAEIAAGTAAGGPWGAIIAAAWAMRHTLFKILVCICLGLVFLIAMVVSLPSIVFNNIFRTDPVTVDPAGPTEIFALYDEMSATVAGCVGSGYEYARSEIERIIASGDYDYEASMEATIDYGRVSADYDVCYVLSAYSASMNQKGTSKKDLKNKLDAVVPLMFPVTYEVLSYTYSYDVSYETEDGEIQSETVTVTVYYIQATIHPFVNSVIIDAFSINLDTPYGQFDVRTGDAIETMAMALKRTLYGVTAAGQVPPITDAELAAFLDNLTCSPARKELMRVALSLVGRVPYFWGGKSGPGWNDEWNTPKLVTSAGSVSTGTLRPYGLDCSGYTDWVYKTALGLSLHSGGTWSQWDNSYAITEAELLPGDLGFLDRPGAVDINHVLLYAGKDAKGKQLWVHCSGSAGGVALNSPTYVKYYRRVSGVDLENMAVPGPTGG